MPHRGDYVNTPGQQAKPRIAIIRDSITLRPLTPCATVVSAPDFEYQDTLPARGRAGSRGADTVDCMPRDRRETPVVLSRIYTRVGDDGTSALGDGSRTAKTDPRLAAYADVDEANCAIGVAVAMGGLPADITSLLLRLQNELFDVGSDLCTPVAEDPAYPPRRGDPGGRPPGTARRGDPGGRPPGTARRGDPEGRPPGTARRGDRRTALRIDEEYVTRLEQACDQYNEGLPVLRSFVLPGGSPGAALLHMARTIVRRAERSAWAAIQAHGQTVSPLPARYLNRLSDLLFILARRANEPGGDLLWRPGGER
jgi:cob(I)alamin adenosyltransferase